MKFKTLIIWGIMIVFGLNMYCQKQKITDWEKDNLKGKVKFYSEFTYYENVPLTRPKKHWDGNLKKIFNAKGKIIKELEYRFGTLESTRIYKYDSEGKLIEINKKTLSVWYRKYIYRYYSNKIDENIPGVQNVKEIYKYDSEGKLIEINENSNWQNKQDENDCCGGELIEINESNNSSFSKKKIYEYDAKGNNIGIYQYDTNGKLNYKQNFKYDSKGKMIEKSIYFDNEIDGKSYNKESYKYDSKGKMIEKRRGKDGSFLSKSIFYSFKDGETDKIEEVYYPGEDGNLYIVHILYYNAKGHMFEQRTYDPKGNLVEHYYFPREYDSHGNWIKYYWNNNITEREFEYFE